ncbi:MAG TPA: hypothetical protein VF659_09235 [Pyrinomonadaceae bacterium]|jgi:hypothetical protein
MTVTATSEAIDKELAGFRAKPTRAERIFARQSERIENLEYEADEAGLARDKALYWLFRFCEAVERGQIALVGDELKEVNENALNVLFDNNIFVGLDEPDAAILRLMEIIERDKEGHEHVDG